KQISPSDRRTLPRTSNTNPKIIMSDGSSRDDGKHNNVFCACDYGKRVKGRTNSDGSLPYRSWWGNQGMRQDQIRALYNCDCDPLPWATTYNAHEIRHLLSYCGIMLAQLLLKSQRLHGPAGTVNQRAQM
ncbi:hypothetical protein S83_018563, partial [Arachis hypogaea]